MANDLVARVLGLSETLTIAIAPHSALGSDWAVAPNAARPISTEAALANNIQHGTARQHPATGSQPTQRRQLAEDELT
ncbi:hypothetical protein [Mycobacterium sp.]|uniref:hypothetical protein n=1 Tax=Mycobacterium sp. TaxID=1785 RepID=UPI003BA9BD1A